MADKIFDLEDRNTFTIQTGYAKCPYCKKEGNDLIYQYQRENTAKTAME